MVAWLCNICQKRNDPEAVETGSVRSNVRIFQSEKFAVWRCARCKSIHARDDVDLGYYYAKYPFHDLPVDWRLRAMYDNQLRRLRRAGVRVSDSVLDYGCGRGLFLDYLRSRGFDRVAGFDEYSDEYSDRRVLEARYDCVISQDVIEHVPSPNALLDEFGRLVEPGGVIAVGTPNAATIDLEKPEDFEHALHQPYHRHILSKRALLDAGASRGWKLIRYYPTMYANTLVPFINSAFVAYYAKLYDNSLDVLLEPIKPSRPLLYGPLTLFLGFLGYFFARETDVAAVFRAG